MGYDLHNILRLSYDNAKVPIDFQRTSNLQEHLMKNERLFLRMIHLWKRKVVWDSVHKLAYDIPNTNLSML